MLMELAIVFCPILKNEIEQPRNRFSGILEECFCALEIVNTCLIGSQTYISLMIFILESLLQDA